MESLRWRKSSRSNGSGGDCVEVAETPGTIFVRDSKDPAGPTLQFEPGSWLAFVAGAKHGEFDL